MIVHARQHSLWYALLFVVVVNLLVWSTVVRAETSLLRVTFLDVGQGDAIFIEAPGGVQMLIDGGPDRSVLRELGRVMPWGDRSIDVVLATHPDKDHIGGLIPVIERYRVSHIIDPRLAHDTSFASAFEEARDAEGAALVAGRRGTVIDLGGGVYFEILFPDRDLPGLSDVNSGSIIGVLRYGETDFLLSGDAPETVENYLVTLNSEALEAEVLKAGHHGSRTSTGEALLGAANPEYVVISAGADNQYGHPHSDVVARIGETRARMLATYEKGAIRFVSDGASLRLD